MNSLARFARIALVIAGFFLLHSFAHQYLFSLTPLVITIPTFIVWNSRHPTGYILVWLLLLAPFSTTSFAVLLVVTLAPWIIRKLFPAIAVDLSFSFLAVLILSVVTQLGLIASAQSWSLDAMVIPWLLYSQILFSCTMLLSVLSILAAALRTSHE